MTLDLAHSTALVTGGGRGIGAATCRALAARGCHVLVADVDKDGAADTAREIGGRAAYLDVTDLPAFTELLDDVEAARGCVDILVNNAGIMPLARLDQEPDTVTSRQLALNLHAVIHGTREAVRRMVPRGRGHIVNVASGAGRTPQPGAATYCATKFGVVGLSESVRLELRGTGVNISCVQPAIVATELSAGVKQVRVVRSVTPEDVALAVVRAIERPRFDVFVPRELGVVIGLSNALPRRVREALTRALGADDVLLAAVDGESRSAYEQRAAALE